MKAIITEVTTIEFDLEVERKRIKKIFNKKINRIYRDKLIEVIDIFEKYGYDKSLEAYYKLPYNEADEYHLQESMGKWWWQLSRTDFLWDENVKKTATLEIVK